MKHSVTHDQGRDRGFPQLENHSQKHHCSWPQASGLLKQKAQHCPTGQPRKLVVEIYRSVPDAEHVFHSFADVLRTVSEVKTGEHLAWSGEAGLDNAES